MREIKFRGLRKKYNAAWHQSKWKYGNLLNSEDIGEVGANLDSYEYAEVIPKTVGQFTGLKDKNGIACIYEGDILSLCGTIKGNIYESSEMDKEKTDIIIPSITSKDWVSAYKKIMGRGCKHAE